MSNRACHHSRGRIQLRMNGLQIKLSTNFTFTAENTYNSPLYSMPTDELNLVQQSQFSKTRRKQRTTKLHFSSVGKHAVKWLPAADRKHLNTSCGDTVNGDSHRLPVGRCALTIRDSEFVQEERHQIQKQVFTMNFHQHYRAFGTNNV